jgi:hypothetical protein
LPRPVVVGHLLRRRLQRAGAEVPGCRIEQFDRDRILRRVVVALGVDVHVDREQLVEVGAVHA